MNLLAIDPGSTQSAYISTRRDGTSYQISQFGKVDNEAVKSILESNWEAISIEMIASYGMPVGAEVFETCLWIGRFVQAAAPKPVRLVYRREVKMHLCGSMKAKDGNIRQALIDKIGPQGTKKNPGPTYGISGDVWSALAVAVYTLESPLKFK